MEACGLPFVILGEVTSATFWVMALGAFVLLVFSTIVPLASRYKRCPSDQILVVYGKTTAGAAAKPIHGGDSTH